MPFEGAVRQLTSKAGPRRRCSQLNRSRLASASSSGCWLAANNLGVGRELMHRHVVTGKREKLVVAEPLRSIDDLVGGM